MPARGLTTVFALNPQAWREMVDATRLLEAALGDGAKVVEANERQTVVVQRRAIRTRADLGAGHVLTADDLQVLRPCPPDALDPRDLPALLGRTLARPKAREEALTWADLA